MIQSRLSCYLARKHIRHIFPFIYTLNIIEVSEFWISSQYANDFKLHPTETILILTRVARVVCWSLCDSRGRQNPVGEKCARIAYIYVPTFIYARSKVVCHLYIPRRIFSPFNSGLLLEGCFKFGCFVLGCLSLGR